MHTARSEELFSRCFMPWLWSLVRGRARKMFRVTRDANRTLLTRLGMIPLEDRIVPATTVDPVSTLRG